MTRGGKGRKGERLEKESDERKGKIMLILKRD